MRANFKDDYLLTESEFADEVRWVISKLSSEKDSLFYSKPYLRDPFQTAVEKFWSLFLVRTWKSPSYGTTVKTFSIRPTQSA